MSGRLRGNCDKHNIKNEQKLLHINKNCFALVLDRNSEYNEGNSFWTNYTIQ